MAGISAANGVRRFGATQRQDLWWIEILPVITVLSAFGIYATFRAFEGKFYEWGPYLSPFYSPLIDPAHHWWPFSPAILILAGPLGFRATCYYYRKAYYRAFFLDPPACAKHRFRSSFKTSTVIFSTSLSFFSASCGTTPCAPSFSRKGLESASARS
jgi:hypothetical protein